MAQLCPIPRLRFLDPNGNLLVGGKLYSYAAGTATPLATYTDASEASANPNPVILDSNGEAAVWIGASAYKFVLKDPNDNVLWTADNVAALNNGSVTTIKLADGAVTFAKLAANAVQAAAILDGSVTTTKLALGAVTSDRVASQGIATANLADAAVTTAKLGAGAVTRAKVDDVFYASLGLAKNKIINGNFAIYERGSFGPLSDGTYILDRWQYQKSAAGTMAHIAGPILDAPSFSQAGRLYTTAGSVNCSTAQTTIASTDYALLTQKIEGNVFRSIAQRAFNLSFWVKATKTGTYCVSFRNKGNDKSFVAEYSVNTTATWEKKSVSVSASPATGTWNYDKDIGLQVSFAFTLGSSFQVTAGSWVDGKYFGTSNQVNACDSTTNTFSITNVQIEDGASATDFEDRNLTIERPLCQRYYQNVDFWMYGYNPSVSASRALGGLSRFAAPMRGVPFVSLSGTVAGNCTNVIVLRQDPKWVIIVADFAVGTAGPAVMGTTVVCDAEL